MRWRRRDDDRVRLSLHRYGRDLERVSSTAMGAGSANLYAAMPSMHIGWTTIGALWIAAALPVETGRGRDRVIHLTLMCLTVMITANHYWLDIVGGWVTVRPRG
ncbi:MAG: phosphatase PAP2 family protein [Thermomicrobiales bacterium]